MRTPRLDVNSPTLAVPPTADISPAAPVSLKELIQRLNESIRFNDFEAIVRWADTFRKVMRSQIEEEDSPNGLLTDMELNEPRLAPRVKRLRDQRRNVLRLLANIRDAASFSLDKTKLLVPLLLLLFRQYERETRRVIDEFYFHDDVGCDGG